MTSISCMSRRALRCCMAALTGGVLAGCASTPQPVLLTLPAAVTVAHGAQVSPVTEATTVLVLGRIDMPEYLVARRVRYRDDASTLAEWPDTFWAERIEIGVAREFAAALRQGLPDWRLCEANCGEQAPVASLQVVIERMDYLRSERRLRAVVRTSLWSHERVPRLLGSQTQSHDIPGDADSAQSQARAVTQLLQQAAVNAAGAINTIAWRNKS